MIYRDNIPLAEKVHLQLKYLQPIHQCLNLGHRGESMEDSRLSWTISVMNRILNLPPAH